MDISKHIKNNHQKQKKIDKKKKKTITQSKHTEIIHRNAEMLLASM